MPAKFRLEILYYNAIFQILKKKKVESVAHYKPF